MKFTERAEYTNSKDCLKLTRTAIKGEPAVKLERETFLPHPNTIDPTSPEQIKRYTKYIAGAEFDGFPAETKASMIGQMTAGDIDIEIPDSIGFLVENSDGDGLGLSGAIEVTEGNILEAKYHILLSEYKGYPSVKTEDATLADIQGLNPAISIKHYTRESLIDWQFERVNGVTQLTLMVLCQVEVSRDLSDLSTKEVKTYLVLGLDGEGYYQEKYIDNGSGDYQISNERHYPDTGNGEKWKYIPVSIVIDEKWQAGSLPTGPGYLYPVASASIQRYVMSANYKEAIEGLQPTEYGSGWKDGDYELFEKINEGRKYIARGHGVVNNLPNDVVSEIKGVDSSVDHFMDYFAMNEEKIRALGGKVNMSTGEKAITATESAINSAKNTAVMSSIVSSVEQAFRRQLFYCGVYAGIYQQDAMQSSVEDITLNLPREFGIKLTPEQVMAVLATYEARIFSREEAARILVQGGYSVSDIDTILNELSDAPAVIE